MKTSNPASGSYAIRSALNHYTTARNKNLNSGAVYEALFAIPPSPSPIFLKTTKSSPPSLASSPSTPNEYFLKSNKNHGGARTHKSLKEITIMQFFPSVSPSFPFIFLPSRLLGFLYLYRESTRKRFDYRSCN